MTTASSLKSGLLGSITLGVGLVLILYAESRADIGPRL